VSPLQVLPFWDFGIRNTVLVESHELPHVYHSYGREKSTYTGPWNIPKRRAKKHPLAPKRPMSAFLKYSQTRRSLVKHQNPDMSNTDVSRLLGEMWRSAPEREKRPYVETEERERATYKQETAAFKAQQARVDAASRTPHASISTESLGVTGNYLDVPIGYHDGGYRQSQDGYYHNAGIYRQPPISAYHQDVRHRQPSSLTHQPYPIHYGYSFSQGKSLRILAVVVSLLFLMVVLSYSRVV
jgi:HMG (high mobility group) box